MEESTFCTVREMRYYFIELDKEYVSAVRIKNWFKNPQIRNILDKKYDEVEENLFFYTEQKENIDFTDIISHPFFLLAERVREAVMAFLPNLTIKNVYLFDEKKGEAKEYFLPCLEEMDCLTEDSCYNRDKSVLEKAVLDKSKIGDRALFSLKGPKNNYIVARLDFIEVLSRYYFRGMKWTEVETVGEEVIYEMRNLSYIYRK